MAQLSTVKGKKNEGQVLGGRVWTYPELAECPEMLDTHAVAFAGWAPAISYGIHKGFFFVEMRDRNAFVPWSLSLPVKRHEGAAAAARRVPSCARCPDTGSGLHWCSRASLTQIRPAPRACPGPHTDVASLFLWLCVCWWLGRTTQAQSLKQRPSQSTACSRILLPCLWARLCQQTPAAFSVDACLCNKKLMP